MSIKIAVANLHKKYIEILSDANIDGMAYMKESFFKDLFTKELCEKHEFTEMQIPTLYMFWLSDMEHFGVFTSEQVENHFEEYKNIIKTIKKNKVQ